MEVCTYEKIKQVLAKIIAENEGKTIEEALAELDADTIDLEECLDKD